MKRTETTIFGLLLTMVLISCSGGDGTAPNESGIQVDTELHYDNGFFHLPGEDEPYTGEVKWYYATGEQAAVLMYRDGYLESRKEFYPGGNLMSELIQEKDTLIYSTRMYRSGQVYTEYKRGTVKQWYENGQLQAEWSTDSAGILQDKATAWYQDGTLMGIEHYRDGELEGERIMYDREGIRVEQAVYENGERLDDGQ